jgi:hypothetical protein
MAIRHEIPITNWMTIFILFLAKFCYVATKKKKKLPSKCTKGFFGKNAPKKSHHILRGKMSEVAIFRE